MNTDIIRSHLLQRMRNFLYQNGYIEVFSPVLRNSDSYINPRFKLTDGRFLRDCMELSLRKRISPFCPKIFEIGVCFRQDVEDYLHRQEFYMMELYAKDETLKEMMELTKGIINECLPFVGGIKEISLRQLMRELLGVDIAVVDTRSLIEVILNKHPNIEKKNTLPHLVVNRYIELIIEPILSTRNTLYFLTDYPLCTIAIASRKENSNCIQRFECFVNNIEIANAFEDCMDAIDLTLRLKESGIMGKEEEELVELVKNSKVFPTVGLGIGIDRLCTLMLRYKEKGGIYHEKG